MLRLKKRQLDWWDALLSPELLTLNEELTTVDQWLEDERFLLPFLKRNKTKTGRPTIPISLYLRLMYLKHRYQLGYEMLVKEVSDSVQWRRFCGLSLKDKVPDASTLIKLTKRFGEDVVDELNDQLVLKLREKKVVRGKKLRADTKAIAANIHYPTDPRLLSDGVKVITRLVQKLRSVGVATKTKFVAHTRVLKKLVLGLSKFKELSLEKRNRLIKKAIKYTRQTVNRAKAVVDNVGRALRNKRIAESLRNKIIKQRKVLKRTVRLTERLIWQTEQVFKGITRIPHRIVSLFDPQARAICKGQTSSKPPTFGYKVLLEEIEQGIISRCRVLEGNPNDETLWPDVLSDHQELFGHPPDELALDRGFFSTENEAIALSAGVKRVCLPAKGRKTSARRAYERQPWFRRLQRFRAGIEGRLSLLSRCYGFDRSLLLGLTGTAIWTGWGSLAQNLWQVTRLLAPP